MSGKQEFRLLIVQVILVPSKYEYQVPGTVVLVLVVYIISTDHSTPVTTTPTLTPNSSKTGFSKMSSIFIIVLLPVNRYVQTVRIV